MRHHSHICAEQLHRGCSADEAYAEHVTSIISMMVTELVRGNAAGGNSSGCRLAFSELSCTAHLVDVHELLSLQNTSHPCSTQTLHLTAVKSALRQPRVPVRCTHATSISKRSSGQASRIVTTTQRSVGPACLHGTLLHLHMPRCSARTARCKAERNEDVHRAFDTLWFAGLG